MRHTTTTHNHTHNHKQRHTPHPHTAHTHKTHTHSLHTTHTPQTCQDPKDGELCLIRAHVRGVSWRYRRTNRSLHSAQQLVPSEVSLRIAEFQQFSSLEESATIVLVWTCSPTLIRHDRVVTSCKLPVRVISPRGQILAIRTDDSWS